MRSAFGVEHVVSKAATAPAPPARRKPSDKQVAEGVAVGGTAVVANEARGAVSIHRRKSTGQDVSRAMRDAPARRIKGISDAGPGTRITQATHPPGTYHISMDTLAHHQNRPVRNTKAREAAASANIKREGFREPIQVKVYRNGADLWDGNHRTMAARALGHKSIPVHVEHVASRRPMKSTLYGAFENARTATYRHGLLRAARVAKGATMSTSAFGVQHEISKAAGGGVLRGGQDELAAAKWMKKWSDPNAKVSMKVTPKKPVGAGSKRRQLDPEASHWPASP